MREGEKLDIVIETYTTIAIQRALFGAVLRLLGVVETSYTDISKDGALDRHK